MITIAITTASLKFPLVAEMEDGTLIPFGNFKLYTNTISYRMLDIQKFVMFLVSLASFLSVHCLQLMP